MAAHRITRRQALLGAGAMAALACTPGTTTATGAPAASGTPAVQVAKFNWLFGFVIQAGPVLPIVMAKQLGYYDQQKIAISWDFQTVSTAVRLIGTDQYQGGNSDPQTTAGFVTEGVPLVAVAQQSLTSVRAFAVRKNDGIKRPKDFEGRKVGIKSGAPWADYLAVLAADKVDRTKITEVPIGFSSVELKEKIVDVLPVFLGNEPFVLKTQLNVDYDILLPRDFGYPAVGTPIIANKSYIKNNRDVYLRFLRSVFHAQEDFIANKDLAMKTAIEYGGTATTKEAHDFIYEVSKPTMINPKGAGFIDVAAWQKNLDILTDLKVLPGKVNAADIVDDTLMPQILKDGKVIWPG